MSASTISLSQLSSQPQSMAVSFRVLLALYAIVPICLALQAYDQFFLGGYLQATLPSSPKHYLVLQLLFGTPHILASAITLGSNADYVQFFKPKLLGMTAFIILFFGVGSLFIPYKVLYCITAIWTVYHVLKQQHGIARGIYQLPGWTFNSLLALSVGAGIAVYLGIFLKNSLAPLQTLWLQNSAVGLCLGLLVMTLVGQAWVKSLFGKVFLWANSLLVFSSCFLYLHQYYFLAILVPRLVHDATAFIVYVTHDYNRHHEQPENGIYRWAAHWHLPIILVLPMLAFGLTFMLQVYGDALINEIVHFLFDVEIRKAATLGIVGYLSLMHYYTEGFTWRQGSPYRQFIRFKH